jgi:carbonic anhydrase
MRSRAGRDRLKVPRCPAEEPHRPAARKHSPALDNLDEKLAPETLANAAVEANVRWTIRQLLESPERQTAVQDELMLVGAVYGLQTGRVRFLE